MNDDVAKVWEAYRRHHQKAMLAPERRRLIERRLGEGWPVETLIDAIDGNHLDPHCNGENDRSKQYHGIGLILRDADRIERYAALAEADRPVDPVDSAWWTFEAWRANRGDAWAIEQLEGTFPDEIVDAVKRRFEGVVL
jgi:hypothetical protein